MLEVPPSHCLDDLLRVADLDASKIYSVRAHERFAGFDFGDLGVAGQLGAQCERDNCEEGRGTLT